MGSVLQPLPTAMNGAAFPGLRCVAVVHPPPGLGWTGYYPHGNRTNRHLFASTNNYPRPAGRRAAGDDPPRRAPRRQHVARRDGQARCA